MELVILRSKMLKLIVIFFLSVMEFMEKVNFKQKHAFYYYFLLRPSLALIKPTLFHTKTVQEILWGYDDNVLKAAQLVKSVCPVPKGFSTHVQLKVLLNLTLISYCYYCYCFCQYLIL